MSTDVSSANYVIRTKDGDKGPYTGKQICKLVVKGKLSETVKVRDITCDKSVLVADIVSGKAYQNQFEDEALGVASDLMEANIDDDYVAHDVQAKPQQTKEADPPSSASARSRRTQSHRRNTASRVMDEVDDGRARPSRKKKNDQSLMLAGGVVVACIIVAVLMVVLTPEQLQGRWVQGSQVMVIGPTVIQIKEGTKTIIHGNYTLNADQSELTTEWFEARTPVTISIGLSGDTLSTSYDGANALNWVRQ